MRFVDGIRCVDVSFFFFFQAEDGIRDLTVTGVQTCALPISDDLARPGRCGLPGAALRPRARPGQRRRLAPGPPRAVPARGRGRAAPPDRADRKSTRLNSSHSQIAHAVFCLKNKIYEVYNETA